MTRIIVSFLLLLILTKPSKCQRPSPGVFTFLKTDVKMPGPSMSFNISLASGVFEFKFKTWVDRALVLYQDDKGISDHILLSIQGGRLWFSFYGSKNSRADARLHGKFTSKKTYNDFKWYTVRIERNASITSIFITKENEENEMEKKSFKTSGLSSFTSNLAIGGLASDQYRSDLSDQAAFTIYATPIDK